MSSSPPPPHQPEPWAPKEPSPVLHAFWAFNRAANAAGNTRWFPWAVNATPPPAPPVQPPVDLHGVKSLKHLSLQESKVTDAGMVHLPSQLVTLRLVGTNETDAGLIHLSELMNLERVSLADTHVTAAGVNQLQAANPTLRILWDAPAK